MVANPCQGRGDELQQLPYTKTHQTHGDEAKRKRPQVGGRSRPDSKSLHYPHEPSSRHRQFRRRPQDHVGWNRATRRPLATASSSLTS